MAAYEDWIPLDPEIFAKLDTCDPSFSWELLKNEVIKYSFKSLTKSLSLLLFCLEQF